MATESQQLIPSAGLGHNNPPTEAEIEQSALDQLKTNLALDILPLTSRAAELLKAVNDLKAKIEAERQRAGAEHGCMGKDDAPGAVLLAKQLTLLLTDLDAEKKRIQAPFDARVAAVRSVFATASTPLEEAKTAVLEILGAHMAVTSQDTLTSEFGQNAIWKYTPQIEVLNPVKVPVQFLVPDMAAIRDHYKSHMSEAAKLRKKADSSAAKAEKERGKAKPEADTIAAYEADAHDLRQQAAELEQQAMVPGIGVTILTSVVVS